MTESDLLYSIYYYTYTHIKYEPIAIYRLYIFGRRSKFADFLLSLVFSSILTSGFGFMLRHVFRKHLSRYLGITKIDTYHHF